MSSNMAFIYIKFPTGAWGNYFAKLRNFYLQKTGGDDGIRAHDPLVVNEEFYVSAFIKWLYIGI